MTFISRARRHLVERGRPAVSVRASRGRRGRRLAHSAARPLVPAASGRRHVPAQDRCTLSEGRINGESYRHQLYLLVSLMLITLSLL